MKRPVELDRVWSPQSDYQEFSRQFVSRFSRALRKESWGRTAVELAWTAGPVTYLALNGGYYLGFGVPAPPQLFFYFGAYTLIAGLFAVLVRVGYNAVRGHEHERMEHALTEVMGQIPELVAAVRNQSLEAFDEEYRTFLGAKYLLDNADASEQAIGQAVFDLTGSSALAYSVRSIEVFRRAGLTARIADLSRESSDILAQALPAIQERSFAVAEEVRRRFAGIVPQKRQGRIRTEGFVERVLSAGEQDNYDLMSLSDVEEVLTLAFELLAGRSYTFFSLQYVGQSALREVDNRLERVRRELREAIHVRNSRLRVLAEFLNESEAIHRVPAAIPVLLQIGEVYRNVQRAVDDVYSDMAQRVDQAARKFSARELEFYRKLVQLWESLQRANEGVNRRRAALGRALTEYEKRLHSSRQDEAMRILAPGQAGNGVRLIASEATLSARQRMRLALRLWQTISDVTSRSRFVVFHDSVRGSFNLNSDGYKHLAASLAIVLDQMISLGNSELRSAIEASSAANVGTIETGLSRDTRIGWGIALVREIHEEIGKTVGRLVSSLAYYHGMQITDAAVAHLVETYGAQESLLRRYAVGENVAVALPDLLARLSHEFLEVRPLPKSWYTLGERIQKQVHDDNV